MPLLIVMQYSNFSNQDEGLFCLIQKYRPHVCLNIISTYLTIVVESDDEDDESAMTPQEFAQNTLTYL